MLPPTVARIARLPVRSAVVAVVVGALALLAGCGADPGAAPLTGPAEDGLRAGAQVPGQLLVLRRPGHMAVRAAGYRVLRREAHLGLEVVTPIDGSSVAELRARLVADPAVLAAEPNTRVTVPGLGVASRPTPAPAATPASGGFGLLALIAGAPSDPMVGQQYALAKVHAFDAWNTTRGDGVTVAVLDSGVDLGHPDLRPNLVPGLNVFDGSPDAGDEFGHGTHVAGIIAAASDNGVGGCGIAPRARIMPVKVLDAHGAGDIGLVAAGITWAVDHGAGVVNMSLGGPQNSAVIQQAVAYAISRGVPVIAAMGNDGDAGNERSYPASYPGVIAVGATDPRDQVPGFSCTGSWISVVAPGWGIVSTFPRYDCELRHEMSADVNWFYQHGTHVLDDGYAQITGTSQATPVVSAVVALMRAKNPSASPDALRQQLMQSARHLDGTFDVRTGAGLVNAAAAVAGI